LLLGHPVTSVVLQAAVWKFFSRHWRRQRVLMVLSLLLKWANTSLIPINMSSVQKPYRVLSQYILVCTFHIFAIRLRIYRLCSLTLRYTNISQCVFIYAFTPRPSLCVMLKFWHLTVMALADLHYIVFLLS
jgi:hypothetical protein